MANDPSAISTKIADALKELYGDERVLIVLNTTNGVVSVGFGEKGNEGGQQILRSKLPQVLTHEYAADTWLKSSDFRRAIAKGWIRLVGKKEAEDAWESDAKRKAMLERMAAKDKGTAPAYEARINPIDTEDPTGEPMVINEETAQLQPASSNPEVRRFMAYEGMETAEGPTPNAPPGVTVIGGDLSARATALVERTKRGDLQPLEALSVIDEDEKLLNETDLNFIAQNAAYDSVKSYARKRLAERANGVV